MKRQNPIDDLFRRELGDLEIRPSPGRRAAFLKEVRRRFGDISRTSWWIAGGIGLVLLMSGISVVLITSRDPGSGFGVAERSTQNTSAISANSNKVNNNTKSLNNTNTGKPKSTNQEPGTKNQEPGYRMQDARSVSKTPNPQSSTPVALASSTNPASQAPAQAGGNVSRKPGAAKGETGVAAAAGVTASKNLNQLATTTGNSNPVTQSPAPSNPVTQNPVTQNPVTQNPVTQNPATSYPVTQSPAPSYPVTQNPAPGTDTLSIPGKGGSSPSPKGYKHDDGSNGMPRKWNISAGLYYTPEWMFNTLNGDKFVNNMGLEGTFRMGRYSVRTGVGLSITTGSNELRVESNPYLGSYKALDSIIFIWDEKRYNLIPIYYTTGKEVFDTALHYNYTYNKKRYTYLQVPLILGYDFWQNSWLSLGVRGGAVMSILMKTENLTSEYDAGKDKIIMINNVSPDRVALNWQAVAGFNAAFRLSRRFSIEVEPNIRYYFNSVYESSEITTKPWSVGLRAAFVITW